MLTATNLSTIDTRFGSVTVAWARREEPNVVQIFLSKSGHPQKKGRRRVTRAQARRAEGIRRELRELFPGSVFEVEARQGVFSGIIAVKWTDGPALTRVKETGIRERYDRVLVEERTGSKAKTGSVFVKYERSYSPEALDKARCTSPYLSYDYVLLSEMDFPD